MFWPETTDLNISPPLRYQGREGWAPASYLKKMDIQSQKQSAGAASTNDLDGVSKQQNNAAKENRDNSQKENRLSFFSDNKSKCILNLLKNSWNENLNGKTCGLCITALQMYNQIIDYRISFHSTEVGSRHRPPPRRDLTIVRDPIQIYCIGR